MSQDVDASRSLYLEGTDDRPKAGPKPPLVEAESSRKAVR
jgi:hypothetical protein